MSRIFRWSKRPFVLTITGIVCLLLAPTAEGGELLCDGVVLDADAGVAYAMSPAGGIDAIDLVSGAVQWSSHEAAKPLHLTDGMLIAQGEAIAPGRVELAALAAESGARRHGMTVSLPADVWTGVDDRPGRSFRCHLGGGASRLTASWRESRAVDTRFAISSPALDETSDPVIASAAVGGSRSGAATLDLVRGTVAPMEASRVAASSLSAPVHQFGPYLAGVEGRQRLSANGGHVLASVQTGDPGDWQKYRWSIYTAAGDLVGSIAHHTASAPFTVAGSVLVFRDQPYTLVVDGAPVSEPLKLRGIDLASGVEVWSSPLRDTAYRGPFEP